MPSSDSDCVFLYENSPLDFHTNEFLVATNFLKFEVDACQLQNVQKATHVAFDTNTVAKPIVICETPIEEPKDQIMPQTTVVTKPLSESESDSIQTSEEGTTPSLFRSLDEMSDTESLTLNDGTPLARLDAAPKPKRKRTSTAKKSNRVVDSAPFVKAMKAFSFAGIDPLLRGIAAEFILDGNLKEELWEDSIFRNLLGPTDLPGFTSVNEDHEIHQYAYKLVASLTQQNAFLSACLAYRIYLIGQFETAIETPTEITKEEVERFPFLTQGKILDTLDLLFACLYEACRTVSLVLQEEVKTVYRIVTEEQELKRYAFQFILAICKIKESEDGIVEDIKPFNLEPNLSKQDYVKSLKAICNTKSRSVDLDQYEKAYYDHIMMGEPISKKRPSDSPKVSSPKRQKVIEPMIFDEMPDIWLEAPFTVMPVAFNKPRVFIIGEFVYKGPFKCAKRLERARKISEMIKFLVIPGANFAYPDGYCKQGTNYFIRYSNLAVEEPGMWTKQQDTFGKGKSARKVVIVTPKSMGIERYNEFAIRDPKGVTEEHLKIISRVYTWFNLFRIPERNLDNILLVKGKLWFINFDGEVNTKEPPIHFNRLLSNFMFSDITKIPDKVFSNVGDQYEDDLVQMIYSIGEQFGADKISTDITEDALAKMDTPFNRKLDELGFQRKQLAIHYVAIGASEFMPFN